MTTNISDSEIYTNTMDIVEYLKTFNTHNKKLDVSNEIEQMVLSLNNLSNINFNRMSRIFEKNIYLKINNIIKYHKYLLDCGKQNVATTELKWSIDMLIAIGENI